MAESLKALAKCSMMAFGLAWMVPAHADTLNDPTRPPSGMPVPGEAQPAANLGPVLQMVTISRHRKSATISGQQLLLGEKYGEAVLIRVADGEVSLRNVDGSLENLRMYAGVEKKMVQPEKRYRQARPTQVR
ncbi:MAG TPA: hypothetical protein VGK14_00860 [Novimethylophilus sp.]|jgi:hypothetical protein|uniref:hypothetical protein n=1 Tax=Novimethylophilus sp. TaxID=2137426 RepID=UPI002F3ED159